MTKVLEGLAAARREGWERWIRCEADERAVAQGCRFDLASAERVRTFFRRFLRHSKGEWAGKPFELLDWQWEMVVGPLFGWLREDGSRRFRRSYIEVPKKNGKSSLFSGLGLYLLSADREPGAEVYSAAVDRDQASIVFLEAANMVDASPELSSRLQVVRSTKRIVFHRSRSFYRALSADVPAKEGINAHAVLIDELHAQKNRQMWDTLRYAGAARRQPLHLCVTTAGYDRHSICWEQHDYALKVLDGTIDDASFLGYIAAASDEADWTDPEVWRGANPSFGVTVSAEQFAEDCREARESAAKENSFRRYRLNQWTEQAVRWLSLEKWDACDGTADLEGKTCFAGLDLSSTTDISALVLVFALEQGRYAALSFFWVPEEGARRRQDRDRVPYLPWIKQGYIEATPGEVVAFSCTASRTFRSIRVRRLSPNVAGWQRSIKGFSALICS
jgi:phage terminase large subunit-like protein